MGRLRRAAMALPFLMVPALLVATEVPAYGAFSAAIFGPTSTFASGSLVLGATTGGTTCNSSTPGVVTTNVDPNCPGAAIPPGPLSTSRVSAATVLDQAGNTAPSSGTMALSSCGVAQVADTTAHNTGLVRNGVSYGSAGPLGATAVSLDAAGKGYVSTTNAFSDPGTLSQVLWFKAPTSGFGGNLMGFTDRSTDAAPTSWDRQIWMDPTGHLVYGVYPGRIAEVTSPGTYNDNTWHLVVASYGPAGQQLWVDGSLVASNPAVTWAQPYTGYWHLGWSNTDQGWPDGPTTDYWNGSIAQVAVVPSQLNSAQVASLATAGTAGDYASALASLRPTSSWPLNDSGSVPYTGSIPGTGTAPTLVDASGHGNTATARGSATLGSPGPLGANAVSLDAAGKGYLSTTSAFSDPGTLSQMLWFKAPTSGFGGNLMGFTDRSTDAAPASWDRQIWMDPTGHLVYGVYPGRIAEVTSPGTYNDNTWHLVVASYGPAGQQLWVDGSLVASNPAVTWAQPYTGYWHLGWSNTDQGWPDGPTTDYWNGSIAQVAVVPSQLNSAQVASLATAGTAGDYANSVLALGPTSYWPLSASASSSSPCSTVGATVEVTTSTGTNCAYPAGSGNCPAPSTFHPLGGITSVAVCASPSATVTISLALEGPPPPNLVGLHVLPDIQFTESAGSFSAGVGFPLAAATL
ncbi:MAG: LamG-like jellyroll fold domain-containing protein [Acidimicrobiales bacterium]